MLSSRASNSMPFLLLQLLLLFWCMQKVTRSPLPLPIQGPSSSSSFAVFSSCLAALLCVSAAVDLSKKTFSTDDHLISYIRPPLFASCRHSIAFVMHLMRNSPLPLRHCCSSTPPPDSFFDTQFSECYNGREENDN